MDRDVRCRGFAQLPDFQGATRHGELRGANVLLSLDDAIPRLEYNVGLLIWGTMSDQTRAHRLEELSELLSNVSASLRESRQKTNLQALGISFPGVPPTVTVSHFDVRASVSASIVNLHASADLRAAPRTDDAAALASDPCRHVRGEGTRDGVRDLRYGGRDGAGDRTDARRLHHRQTEGAARRDRFVELVLVALELGLLQVVADTGQRDDWFASPHITILLITGLTMIVLFLF